MRLWLTCLVASVAVLGASCDSESKPASATAAATAVQSASISPVADDSCPIEAEACEFAKVVAAAIVAADFTKLESLASPEEYNCSGPEARALGAPYPVCAGSAEGETREGFRIRRLNTDGGTVEASILPQVRQSVLDSGLGQGPYATQPRIIGVQCPLVGAADCAGEFIVYFEGAPHFGVRRVDGQLRIGWLQLSDFAEDRSVFVHGGEFPYAGETLRPGRFWRWQPRYVPDPTNEVKERWLLAPASVTGVILRPESGACDATLTVEVPAAPLVQNPKGPAVAEVQVYAGVVGLSGVAVPPRPVHETLVPQQVAGTEQFAFKLERSMLNGAICDQEIVTLIVRGTTAPKPAGYRIEH